MLTKLLYLNVLLHIELYPPPPPPPPPPPSLSVLYWEQKKLMCDADPSAVTKMLAKLRYNDYESRPSRTPPFRSRLARHYP